MKKLFKNPLSCREILAGIALALAATTSLLTPALSFAQTNPGGQGATPLTAPQPTPRGDGGCDSTCSLGVPPLVSQSCVSNKETRSIACSNPTPVGTISQRRSPVYCNGTIVSGGTWANVSNNCVVLVCTPTTSTQTIACPTGYSGGIDQSKTDTSCNDGTSTTGTWTTTANNCVVILCSPTSPNTTAACGPGFNSGLVTTLYSMSAAPACTQTSLVSNTCSCSFTPTTRNVRCPAGYSGTYTVTNTSNAACSAYIATDNSASACSLIPCAAPTSNTIVGCGPGFDTGNITTRYTMSPAPACTQTSAVANTCSCSLTTTNTPTACPAGFTGTYTVTNTPNAACSGYTTTNNQASVCAPVVCPPASAPTSSPCGFGYNSGSRITSYTMGPPNACTQSGSTDSSSCACTLPLNTTNILVCPPNFTGNYTVTGTRNSACSGYTTTNNQASVCIPNPPPPTFLCQDGVARANAAACPICPDGRTVTPWGLCSSRSLNISNEGGACNGFTKTTTGMTIVKRGNGNSIPLGSTVNGYVLTAALIGPGQVTYTSKIRNGVAYLEANINGVDVPSYISGTSTCGPTTGDWYSSCADIQPGFGPQEGICWD